MDEYIVPDNEVEIVTSDEHVNTEDVVATVCYEVPVTYSSVKQETSDERDGKYEPGEYVEEEEGTESQTEADKANLQDEKIFNMIPRKIFNVQKNKTICLTHECVYVLIKWVFERRYNPFPTEAQKTQLSAITKLSMQEIDLWMASVRKTLVPLMILKGVDFINNYMKYHVEKLKAQGKIPVAKFHNTRLLLKKVGSDPIIIGKIQYTPETKHKIQYVAPIKVQKVINNTVDAGLKDIKTNYENSPSVDNQIVESHTSPKGTSTDKLNLNTARYLMTWLFNYRNNPHPSIDQLRHISDVTCLSRAHILRWMITARKKILKKVRESSTVLHPEDYKDCLTWHLNEFCGPKRMKQQLEDGYYVPAVDEEKKIRNTFELSNNKKSPYRMDTSVSGDDSFNGGDEMIESHREGRKTYSKKADRSVTSNKRLFIKSGAEELHPSDSIINYPTPVVVHKGASRKGKGNFPLSSKKVLMDWLFKNRHNPYPTDQEKAELSVLSNLTLLQVNNWFINARRRFLDKMLKTGEECFLIKRQNKGFKELSKSYLRESGEVETEIVTYTDEIMHDDNQENSEIQITEYVCTDSAEQSMVQYQQEIQYPAEYHIEEHVQPQIPSNMIEVQVHLLPTKYEEQGSVVRVRCTEDEAVHVLKAVNSHPTVTLNKIPDSAIAWEVESTEEVETMEEDETQVVTTEEETQGTETMEEVNTYEESTVESVINEENVVNEEHVTESQVMEVTSVEVQPIEGANEEV